MQPMCFEWDPRKARANRNKHRVEFTEAVTVFGDPLSVTIPDPDDVADEDRFVTLGASSRRRLLVVVHTVRGEHRRLIALALRQNMREARTKKPRSKTAGREMRPEYDFSGGVRGKYADRYRGGTNIVVPDPELSKTFPDSKSVNNALRTLLSIADRARTYTRE